VSTRQHCLKTLCLLDRLADSGVDWGGRSKEEQKGQCTWSLGYPRETTDDRGLKIYARFEIMPVNPRSVPQFVLREISFDVKENLRQRDKARKCAEYVQLILAPGSSIPAACKGDGDVYQYETGDGLLVRVWYEHNVQINASVETHVHYEVKDQWEDLHIFERESLVEQARFCRATREQNGKR
jgi:hypothetical protein